jgi:hypothetical protein
MKVGTFEDKMMKLFGIKVQIAGSDDSYLCDNDLTLAGAQEDDGKKLERKEKKASKEDDTTVTEDLEDETFDDMEDCICIIGRAEESIEDYYFLKQAFYIRPEVDDAGNKKYFIYSMDIPDDDGFVGYHSFIDEGKNIMAWNSPSPEEYMEVASIEDADDIVEYDYMIPYEEAEIVFDIREKLQELVVPDEDGIYCYVTPEVADEMVTIDDLKVYKKGNANLMKILEKSGDWSIDEYIEVCQKA